MKTFPANSSHLSSFAIDIVHELEQTGLFRKIKLKKTGSPRCALIAVCSLVDGSTTIAEVLTTLERVWNESLAYYGGENTFDITIAQQVVLMNFATSVNDVRVTGLIEVIGFNQPVAA